MDLKLELLLIPVTDGNTWILQERGYAKAGDQAGRRGADPALRPAALSRLLDRSRRSCTAGSEVYQHTPPAT